MGTCDVHSVIDEMPNCALDTAATNRISCLQILVISHMVIVIQMISHTIVTLPPPARSSWLLIPLIWYPAPR